MNESPTLKPARVAVKVAVVLDRVILPTLPEAAPEPPLILAMVVPAPLRSTSPIEAPTSTWTSPPLMVVRP